MIVVDTSVWVDYLIGGDPLLDELLDRESVLVHPFVVGEVAMGNLRNRAAVLNMLGDLPGIEVSTDEAILTFVAQENLGGTGLSFIDAHLLAATCRFGGAVLWTRDKRLHTVAQRFQIAMDVEGRLQ